MKRLRKDAESNLREEEIKYLTRAESFVLARVLGVSRQRLLDFLIRNSAVS